MCWQSTGFGARVGKIRPTGSQSSFLSEAGHISVAFARRVFRSLSGWLRPGDGERDRGARQADIGTVKELEEVCCPSSSYCCRREVSSRFSARAEEGGPQRPAAPLFPWLSVEPKRKPAPVRDPIGADGTCSVVQVVPHYPPNLGFPTLKRTSSERYTLCTARSD